MSDAVEGGGPERNVGPQDWMTVSGRADDRAFCPALNADRTGKLAVTRPILLAVTDLATGFDKKSAAGGGIATGANGAAVLSGRNPLAS
jgi:hypothetical protein